MTLMSLEKKELIGNWGFTNVTKNWNWKDADQKPVQVAVFSNGDEVELIQNGTSVGKLTSGTRLAADLPHSFLFDLTYLPGTLEAVSYKDGKKSHGIHLSLPDQQKSFVSSKRKKNSPPTDMR